MMETALFLLKTETGLLLLKKKKADHAVFNKMETPVSWIFLNRVWKAVGIFAGQLFPESDLRNCGCGFLCVSACFHETSLFQVSGWRVM